MGAGEESEERYFLKGPYSKFLNSLFDLIEKPVVWFRETVVVPNRQEYYWYHEKIRRVPTVDECYTDDVVCVYEANAQFKLDKRVEKFILDILRKRLEACVLDYPYDSGECDGMKKTLDDAVTNYFIKYGDLGMKADSISCLMKQKNRMAFERRHGPVGSGRKIDEEKSPIKKKTC